MKGKIHNSVIIEENYKEILRSKEIMIGEKVGKYELFKNLLRI